MEKSDHILEMESTELLLNEDLGMNYSGGEELSKYAESKIQGSPSETMDFAVEISTKRVPNFQMESTTFSMSNQGVQLRDTFSGEPLQDFALVEALNFEIIGSKLIRENSENGNFLNNTAERPGIQVHEDGKNLKLLEKAYDLMKQGNSAAWRESENDDILLQKSPIGNSVLHIAALYGNDNCLEKIITQNASQQPHLLAAKNDNDDTPLHVAAKAGHFSTLEKLLAASIKNLQHSNFEEPEEALDEILAKNNQGNTFFHEALLNGHKDVMKILDSLLQLQLEAGFIDLVWRAALFWTNNEGKSVLHLAIEKSFGDIVDHALAKLTSKHQQDQGRGMKKQQDSNSIVVDVVETIGVNLENPFPRNGKHEELGQDPMTGKWIGNHQEVTKLIPYGLDDVPPGESPLILAILNLDQEILKKILSEKEEWIHLRDNKGRTPLHCASSIGYIAGVKELLNKCISCNMERDNDGYFPLHLASASGDAEVVKILLKHCPDPKEIVDNYGRNIVHIAAQMGKLNVIRYILQDASHGLVNMINERDANGNTPLHLATLHCRPKVVHALTWDKRVDLNLVNGKNQTALDAYMQFPQENPPFRQLLTGIALRSAGIEYAKRRSHSMIKVPPLEPEEVSKWRALNIDPYKDRINTLMLVSTLITTIAFAAGFTLPGGTNSSDPEQGMAVMLHRVWFKLFIFCVTISIYGGISVTIVLIWAQMGDITLALFALKVARPLLGVTLATLSVAFLAGVHLVISDLSWLATTLLVLCVICVLMLLLLYTILWFPSSTKNPVIRYISYYPFQFMAWLIDE